MTSDATATTTAAAQRRSIRSRLRTLAQLDGRTTAAKRAHEIAASIESEVGMGLGVTAAQKQLIERVAVLSVLAEDLEARVLAGHDANRSQYIEVAREQRLALEALGAS